MATAKKCDICGKFYDMYGNSSAKQELIEPNTIYLGYTSPSTIGIDIHKKFDLCPGCLEKFYKLFIGEVKEKKNE